MYLFKIYNLTKLKLPILFLCTFLSVSAFAQRDFFKKIKFTHADTLRGMPSPVRTCYDVTFYDLELYIDIDDQSISGSNTIHFKMRTGSNMIQLDLFEEMKIRKVYDKDNNALKFHRKGRAFFVDFGRMMEQDEQSSVTVEYAGKPIVAKNAPWDGGFTWSKTADGKPWVGVSCEGIGASLWWPCKDHLSDEPDSMRMTFSVNRLYKDLYIVSNGQEMPMRYDTIITFDPNTFEEKIDILQSSQWKVTYPINNYNVTLNIAPYAHFSDTYTALDGQKLDLDYYVLPENLEKAKAQFKQVHPTLRAFEKWFGKYPFWRDGFALVETPYLGMEHQGAIAYGNNYMNGYMGFSPPGVKFDYIIVHETGHEWFGNSVSCNDLAEMWLHESFTTYTESVFVEEQYGYEKMLGYVNFFGMQVENNQPMVGPFNVNFEDYTTDIYYKGALMLNTLRHSINNDKLWRDIMKGFYTKFTIRNASGQDFIDFVNEKTGYDYTSFFEHYLYHAKLPELEYTVKQTGKDTKIRFRWKSPVKNLAFPIFFEVGPNKARHSLTPTTEWQELTIKKCKADGVSFSRKHFYVK